MKKQYIYIILKKLKKKKKNGDVSSNVILEFPAPKKQTTRNGVREKQTILSPFIELTNLSQNNCSVCLDTKKIKQTVYVWSGQSQWGVVNGPLKFWTARKILPLFDLLAKFRRLLACSCSQTVCSCWQPRFLVSIARSFVNPSLGQSKCNSVCCLIPINMAIKFSGNARDKGQRQIINQLI